jgi:hypothetical protein
MGLTTAAAVTGAAAAIAFVLVAAADGATRPGYRPARHPVSALALGPRGWLQTANFLVCGTGVTAGAAALAGTSRPLAASVAVIGLALIASGVFPMDPMRGYPPGTPDTTPARYSLRHRVHDAAGAVVFLAIPVAETIAALTPAAGPLRPYSAASAAASLALFGVFGRAWERDSPRAGLWQRLAILAGWTWLAVILIGVGARP